MKTTQQWTATDTAGAKHLGCLEFKDNAGEWQNFEILETPTRLVFGSACNVGFFESGYMAKRPDETTDHALAELLADLETDYNDGPQYTSRIICSERM